MYKVASVLQSLLSKRVPWFQSPSVYGHRNIVVVRFLLALLVYFVSIFPANCGVSSRLFVDPNYVTRFVPPPPQMIGFLSVDGACELYISFITRIAEEDEVRKSPRIGFEADCKRPEPGDEVTEELKRSFRLVLCVYGTICAQMMRGVCAYWYARMHAGTLNLERDQAVTTCR